MAKIAKARASTLLAQNDRFLFVTYGQEEPVYAINGAGTVPRKAAEELIGLFVDLPRQRKGGAFEEPLMPCEDGLFPGFSQTWRQRRFEDE